MGTILTHFELDAGKAQVLAECMESYGVGDSQAEWPNNILSTRTVVYHCGTIARRGEPVSFAVDSDELALCERLSSEAKAVAGEAEVGLGSESGDPFHPFFIAANAHAEKPTRIRGELIRARFGGTIFPLATIEIEPLRADAEWWRLTLEDADESEDSGEELEDFLGAWPALFAWFGQQQDFVDTAMVSIGNYSALLDLDESKAPSGTEMAGSVLPRLPLGLTRGGSLCGLFGWSVQT